MTFTQLEYILAIDKFRHFADAADACFVTQPTLSMQVRKLEKEIGIEIFDRSKQPVIPTEIGTVILEDARKIMAQKQELMDTLKNRRGIVSGELRLGIIPTLAPYLLPLFIQSFTKKYPEIKLVVYELMTDKLIEKLKQGVIDAGIVVTPLQEQGVQEYVLFYEELMAYVSKNNSVYQKSYIMPQDIDPQKLWMLEEGHCIRSQISNLCKLQKMSKQSAQFEYEAGSIETLKRMVELNDGITIIPELATLGLSTQQKHLVRNFKKPTPMREVSLVVYRDFLKKQLISALKSEILNAIPSKIKSNQTKNILAI